MNISMTLIMDTLCEHDYSGHFLPVTDKPLLASFWLNKRGFSLWVFQRNNRFPFLILCNLQLDSHQKMWIVFCVEFTTTKATTTTTVTIKTWMVKLTSILVIMGNRSLNNATQGNLPRRQRVLICENLQPPKLYWIRSEVDGVPTWTHFR